MAYTNLRELYDDPDAYGPKFKGVIRVINYIAGQAESEVWLEMLQRAYHRLAYNTHGGKVDFEEGTLTATFSPRDWERFAEELGVSVRVTLGFLHDDESRALKMKRPPVDNLGTPSLRRDDPSQPARYTMQVN